MEKMGETDEAKQRMNTYDELNNALMNSIGNFQFDAPGLEDAQIDIGAIDTAFGGIISDVSRINDSPASVEEVQEMLKGIRFWGRIEFGNTGRIWRGRLVR